MRILKLACDPRLIIADEPTKGLDANVKAQVVELIQEVTTDKSLLFITHDLSAAAQICDRIAVMYCGEIVEWARTEEIFANPLHPNRSRRWRLFQDRARRNSRPRGL